ncbi:hypothetical protein HMPREF3226_02541 [Prevotella corporis]|uniref:Uncharacterized protein n=1 Tax=Prevotella corporis TaxID=28128 RepID=A0A133PVC5_9BACT|nr:hypothetical protein HMPREF3226_02541 [Prevotella corporis]
MYQNVQILLFGKKVLRVLCSFTYQHYGCFYVKGLISNHDKTSLTKKCVKKKSRM